MYTIQILLTSIGIVSAMTLYFSFMESKKIKADVLITLHKKRVRSISILVVNFILALLVSINFEIPLIPLFLLNQTHYWTMFDMSLNLFRGKDPFYLPKPNKNSEFSDDIFYFPSGGLVQITIKLVIIGLSIFFIIS